MDWQAKLVWKVAGFGQGVASISASGSVGVGNETWNGETAV